LRKFTQPLKYFYAVTRRVKTSEDPAFQLLIRPSSGVYFYIMKNTSTNLKNPEAMKTTKIISALSLILFFALVNAGFSAKPGEGTLSNAAEPTIRYQVMVHFSLENALCNLYEIQVLNEHGQLVAPAQFFLPGTDMYNFYEPGPVNGLRIARLVMVSRDGQHYICPNELYTRPDFKFGYFDNGRSYLFNLYPTIQPPKE
jgi:hypothetical protein